MTWFRITRVIYPSWWAVFNAEAKSRGMSIPTLHRLTDEWHKDHPERFFEELVPVVPEVLDALNCGVGFP